MVEWYQQNTKHASLRFVPKKTHHFLTGLLPRKKIDGAIAVCQQDPLRLIRTDTPVFGSFYTQHVLHCLFISPHGVSWNFLSIYSGYLKDVSWPVCVHACKHAHNITPTILNKTWTRIFLAGVVSMEVRRSTMWIPGRPDHWSRARPNKASANRLRRTASSWPVPLPPLFHSPVSKSRMQSIATAVDSPRIIPIQMYTCRTRTKHPWRMWRLTAYLLTKSAMSLSPVLKCRALQRPV